MKIEPKSIKVKEIFDGYADNGDNGVFAYDGRLAIRPAYQREFVYSSEQAESVIHTILKGFPLAPCKSTLNTFVYEVYQRVSILFELSVKHTLSDFLLP